jgi:hypothetical protein
VANTLVQILIWVVQSELGEPTLQGVEAAMRAALPESAMVRHRAESAAEEQLTDISRSGAAATDGFAATAVVRWSEQHKRVRLHVFKPEQRVWIDREIVFDTLDAPHERGRAAGFALLSMMPAVVARAEALADATDPTGRAPTALTRVDGTRSNADQPGKVRAIRRAFSNPREGALGARWALEAVAHAAMTLRDYGGGFGGRIGVRRYVNRNFAVAAAVRGRAFGVAPAEGNATSISIGGGVAWETATNPQMIRLR